MDSYITRLCWNENGWERPSGAAAQLEAKHSFNAKFGFGFEEWVFCPRFQIDGWRYGFVQGANKSQKRLAGETIILFLYTIGPNRNRYLVGEFQECTILTQEVADYAHSRLAESGTIQQMIDDVSAVKGNSEFIKSGEYKAKWTLDVINMRYKPSHLIRYTDRYTRLPSAPDHFATKRFDRYRLNLANEEDIRTWREAANAGLDFIRPEGIESSVLYEEGNLECRLENRYERDPRARRDCVNHYGTRCVICGFDFAVVYGPVMKNYTHVHHLTSLSTLGPAYKIDPIRDLRPVCPNCHAVLHRREPPFSLDEVRQFLKSV